jgi:hypothetical protein
MDLDHLVGGAVNGAIFALVAVAAARFSRHILAAVLVVAALFYVWFAIDANVNAWWLAAELAGVGIYGYAAVRGVRGSAWWLVGGWALHPVWDVALHWAGPGRAFAPAWYATSCLTYDLMVAGVAAIAILVRTHLTEVPSPMSVASVAPQRPSTACACTPGCAMEACVA